MNSRTDTRAGLPDRVTRVEVTCERIRGELRELRGEMRQLRRTATAEFCVLFSAIITVALGLAGVMANGFGWI